MSKLDGRIHHITYHNAENRFTVARLILDQSRTPVTVVGPMPSPVAGENVRLTGHWTTHPRYGEQFRIETIESRLPATIEGIKDYLTAGVIKGIGRATAESIVKTFGTDTFNIIETAPEKLTAVEGIGAAKANAIYEQWQAMQAFRQIMAYLEQNGVSGVYAEKIFNLYGPAAIDIIRESPYRLCEDIRGIGFAIADRIAISEGIAPETPERATACVRHLLQEAAGKGHVFLLEDDLLDHAQRLFEIEREDIRAAIHALTDADEVVVDALPEAEASRRIYPKGLFEAEAAIAARVSALLALPVAPLPMTADQLLERILSSLLVELTPEQRNALETILTHRVVIITGGPGTGKTTLIRAISAVFRQLGKRICLAAPTGRAARRLSEMSHIPAHTIHKLLEYNLADNFFGRDQDKPIDADAIIIDEASMVDAPLMHHLLNAVSLSSRLIIVGDAFQLPPVGPGNILADLINSGILPVCQLTEIFRQAAESRITLNAHRVRNGEFPEFPENDPFDAAATENGDFFFLAEQDPEAIANTICRLCTEVLPKSFGIDPLKSIQVLSPMHKGVAGTINLNQKLQAALNTGNPPIPGTGFRTGDKVMNLRNNYQKEVYNGDIGTIIGASPANSELTIDFYGRQVEYAMDETGDLTLGYAISVHKSQGSEYPVVILPLITRHYIMLQRNLLYTAITRAQSLVFLLGSQKALSIALGNNKPEMRLSGLRERLSALAAK
ncbi:MAG: ATP-dependent RecD-like DNA helicase [Desulfobacterales bacterium]|nr:ATP-dependent RecD-like DNA helicase [Desulfobacterales bacterium]